MLECTPQASGEVVTCRTLTVVQLNKRKTRSEGLAEEMRLFSPPSDIKVGTYFGLLDVSKKYEVMNFQTSK